MPFYPPPSPPSPKTGISIAPRRRVFPEWGGTPTPPEGTKKTTKTSKIHIFYVKKSFLAVFHAFFAYFYVFCKKVTFCRIQFFDKNDLFLAIFMI